MAFFCEAQNCKIRQTQKNSLENRFCQLRDFFMIEFGKLGSPYSLHIEVRTTLALHKNKNHPTQKILKMSSTTALPPPLLLKSQSQYCDLNCTLYHYILDPI